MATAPWWPIANIGAQPYRPWLLAKRLAALHELPAVDLSVVWLLRLLVFISLATALVAVVRQRFLRAIATGIGAVLLMSGIAVVVLTSRSANLSPGVGAYVLVGATSALLIAAWWPLPKECSTS